MRRDRDQIIRVGTLLLRQAHQHTGSIHLKFSRVGKSEFELLHGSLQAISDTGQVVSGTLERLFVQHAAILLSRLSWNELDDLDQMQGSLGGSRQSRGEVRCRDEHLFSQRRAIQRNKSTEWARPEVREVRRSFFILTKHEHRDSARVNELVSDTAQGPTEKAGSPMTTQHDEIALIRLGCRQNIPSGWPE